MGSRGASKVIIVTLRSLIQAAVMRLRTRSAPPASRAAIVKATCIRAVCRVFSARIYPFDQRRGVLRSTTKAHQYPMALATKCAPILNLPALPRPIGARSQWRDVLPSAIGNEGTATLDKMRSSPRQPHCSVRPASTCRWAKSRNSLRLCHPSPSRSSHMSRRWKSRPFAFSQSSDMPSPSASA